MVFPVARPSRPSLRPWLLTASLLLGLGFFVFWTNRQDPIAGWLALAHLRHWAYGLAFVAAAWRFSAETKFDDFLQAHRDLYAVCVERMTRTLTVAPPAGTATVNRAALGPLTAA